MPKKSFTEGYKRYDTAEGYGNPRQWKKVFSERMTGEEAEQILQGQKETPYTILGIKEGATQSEIKAAFRELINHWHPDRNPAPEAEERSKQIIAAYTKLKL